MRGKGFAVSWLFAPYVGSADIDFFKRIKDTALAWDVVQVARDSRDDRILRYATAPIERFEIQTDHNNPRTLRAREDFMRESLALFEARRASYDFIVSHSNEMVSHDVAAEIKRRHPALPWIAYFGDLFERNPYVKYIPNYPLVQENIDIERQTLRMADLVILNNEYQKSLMFCGPMRRYASKCVVIPHCFDPRMYPADGEERENPHFTLVHTGTLYHVKRTAEPLLRAVDRLIEIYPAYRNRFEVVFFGNTPISRDIKVHTNMVNRNHVRFEEPVSYLKSLEIMCGADALILIDGIFSPEEDGIDCNPFLAGKLMDYMGARKPVLGITMDKGPSADILRASGNMLADDRIDRIAFVLKRYIDRKVSPDFGIYQQYTADRIGRMMDEAFASVLEARAA